MLKTRHIITLTAVTLLSGAAFGGTPRLELAERDFDFGFVPQNAKISHVFTLKSSGDDTLKIEKVTPGCGCTQMPLEKSAIAPGDEASLEIVFSTGAYSGKVVKNPSIQTNEGPDKQTLKFSAIVVTKPDSTYPVVISPYKLDISQYGEQKREEMTFSITNLSDMTLHPTMISCSAGLCDITLPKKIEAGKTAEGVLKLKQEALDTEFEKSVTIQLDDQAQTRFTIPIKRQVRTAQVTPAKQVTN